MATVNATTAKKTIADAVAEYDTLKPLWARSRAVCSGERHVKAFDSILDKLGQSNLLIPFSPSMTQAQYNFYRSEAELPGIVAQFVKTIVGGLLRKQPILSVEGKVPEGAIDWLLNSVSQDGAPLSSFLDEALNEELQTSRAWVYIDHPELSEDATADEIAAARPYPVLWKAESVINWRIQNRGVGKGILEQVVTSTWEERRSDDPMDLHPAQVHTIRIHELVDGLYQIRVYEAKSEQTDTPVVTGQRLAPSKDSRPAFELVKTVAPMMHGEPLEIIPAWPLNGRIAPMEPLLSGFVDKEISLYNKISRRNHLLLGAATYTPILIADVSNEEFDKITEAGLGSWLKIPAGSSVEVLKPPSDSLADMDRAIAASIEEMAKMGIRMLSPETAQSGVALDIRNAAQNAQMGVLNTKISNTIRQVFAFMLLWRYQLEVTVESVQFQLSADFNPTPLGADWLRLATEWYQSGLIPRSVWLQMLKQNDMLEPSYDDERGKQEIMADAEETFKRQDPGHSNKFEGQPV